MPEQVMVVGPMSSGVRLMRNVLQANGIQAWIDLSHGTKDLDWHYPDGTLGKVVVMHRNWKAIQASSDAWWTDYPQRIPWKASKREIPRRYKDIGLHVRYEDLCDKTETVIQHLATWLNIQPWTVDFEITNQNYKWL